MNILLYGKGEIKVTAAIKVASQLTLRYRDYSGLSGWTLNTTTCVLIRGAGEESSKTEEKKTLT